jgi:hypothetical protein
MSDYFDRIEEHLLDAVERSSNRGPRAVRTACSAQAWLRRRRARTLALVAVVLLSGSAAAAVAGSTATPPHFQLNESTARTEFLPGVGAVTVESGAGETCLQWRDPWMKGALSSSACAATSVVAGGGLWGVDTAPLRDAVVLVGLAPDSGDTVSVTTSTGQEVQAPVVGGVYAWTGSTAPKSFAIETKTGTTHITVPSGY